MSISIGELGEVALSLTQGLATPDRYRSLLAAVQRVVPCDAIAILRCDGDVLVPVAWSGLVPEVAGMRLHAADHPRLAAILASATGSARPRPVRFPASSTLPDPWDGLMKVDPHACGRVHACMGCALVVDQRNIGVLSVDAVEPEAFAKLDDDIIATFAALAAAALHVSGLIEALERATQRQGVVLRRLAEEHRGDSTRLLGSGPAMQRLRADIDQVAASDLAVLITGETGVGKELVAKAIHAASPRAHEPIITLNCAALPENLVESQLFGHLRGAFTGATADHAGIFEVADGGTVFLDEVGEMPLAIQAKLLRTLQQGEIQRIGANKPSRVDVRVLAATNRDLALEQAQGRFRTDLYFRLAVFPIAVPALREHHSDILLITGNILERESRRLGQGRMRLDESARTALLAYAWPGNVRELEHVLMRSAVRAKHAQPGATAIVIQATHLGLDGQVHSLPSIIPLAPILAPPPGTTQAHSLREQQDNFTRHVVQQTLTQQDENWSAAARALAVTPSNLQRLAQRLGLRPD